MFGPFFVYCYFGDLVRVRLEEVAQLVSTEVDWIEYPPRFRRVLLMTIRTAQKPMYFSGYGVTAMQCSMESFANVSRLDQIFCSERLDLDLDSVSVAQPIIFVSDRIQIDHQIVVRQNQIGIRWENGRAATHENVLTNSIKKSARNA